MKVLRKTMYPPNRKSMGGPITVVIREVDLKEGITLKDASANDPPELFTRDEIYDVEDGTSIEECSIMAKERHDEVVEEEWDMSILFYWDAMQFQKLTDGGVLANPAPAPLSADQIEYTFRRLFKHPGYRNFTLIAFSNDRFMVQGKSGEVTRSKMQ